MIELLGAALPPRGAARSSPATQQAPISRAAPAPAPVPAPTRTITPPPAAKPATPPAPRTITPPPAATPSSGAGTASRVTITPASAVLEPGGMQQFAAAVLDGSGKAVSPAPPVTWSVDPNAGSIDGSGTFSAGPMAGGTYTIAAAAGSASATAVVTIQASAAASAAPFAPPPQAPAFSDADGGYGGYGLEEASASDEEPDDAVDEEEGDSMEEGLNLLGAESGVGFGWMDAAKGATSVLSAAGNALSSGGGGGKGGSDQAAAQLAKQRAEEEAERAKQSAATWKKVGIGAAIAAGLAAILAKVSR